MEGTLTLGVDCGASGARAHVVERLTDGSLRALTPGASLDWSGERAKALADMLAELCTDYPGREVRLGVCFPGAKTADGRGVARARHGPALPHLLDDLESELERRGVRFVAPVPPLCSDGDAAAWGELWAAGGALAGLRSGYVVGAGTGLAEGLVLDGRCLQVEQLREHLPPVWELEHPEGEVWEDRLSMAGLAKSGIAAWARDLGTFLGDRLELLWRRGASPLERIVVGQRSGALLADRTLDAEVRDPMERALEQRLGGVQDDAMRAAYLSGGSLAPGLLVASTLRAAPAIGAAGRALGLGGDDER